MKLIFIRHGDPDYENDTLTDRGREEAKLLIPRVKQWKPKEIYLSPLGRAQLTARIALELPEVGELPYPVRPWLREFDAEIWRPDVKDKKKIAWDWLPADWMAEEAYFDRRKWLTTDIMKDSDTPEKYRAVCEGVDQILAAHGYVRKGGERDVPFYQVQQESTEELLFFCHLGVILVMLSHLIGASPMVLWHGLCIPPTGVTVVRTEERREGAASFRASTLGDTSHLYAGGLEPTVHGRFTEIFSDSDGRHD